MANPIINSIVAIPAVIAPGGSSVVTINASDPDSRSGVLTGTVKDRQGNVTQATSLLTIADLLGYTLEDTDGVGFTIVERPGQPGVFDVTAP